jgi:hypothetical protein
MTSKHNAEVVDGYLFRYRGSIEAWADDHDLTYRKDEDTWYNDDREPVDIWQRFDQMIDDDMENCE